MNPRLLILRDMSALEGRLGCIRDDMTALTKELDTLQKEHDEKARELDRLAEVLRKGDEDAERY